MEMEQGLLMTSKLTTADAARRLGVSEVWVRQLVARGTLLAERAGERNPILLFDLDEVEAYAGFRAAVNALKRDAARALADDGGLVTFNEFSRRPKAAARVAGTRADTARK